MASRYFAMVRRATLMPCSANNTVILLSLSGFFFFLSATNFFIIARMAVDEHSPPESVATWLEKKYLSSKIPCGVCINFCVVTREIVDSCMSTISAMSCSTSGFIASSPYSRKPRCLSTIQVATFSKVSLRLCKLFKNQLASCKFSCCSLLIFIN